MKYWGNKVRDILRRKKVEHKKYIDCTDKIPLFTCVYTYRTLSMFLPSCFTIDDHIYYIDHTYDNRSRLPTLKCNAKKKVKLKIFKWKLPI